MQHRNESTPFTSWARAVISGRTRQTGLITMKITVFWDAMPCSLIDHYISEEHCIYRVGESSALKMEAARSFEILIMIY
jgi:hypothetical protein